MVEETKEAAAEESKKEEVEEVKAETKEEEPEEQKEAPKEEETAEQAVESAIEGASPEKEDEESKVAMNNGEPESEDATVEPIEEMNMSPFQLLDKLFTFLNTEEKPLNPVLSGYFAKLVTLLLTRRQKQIVPYIFSEENDCQIIDQLVYHVYQKSLSEFLIKLLSLNTAEFEPELAELIQKKQKAVFVQLVEKLGSDEFEDQLNAQTILTENIENKDYFNMLATRETLNQLFEIAFQHNSDECRKSGMAVIVALINIFIEKHRNPESNGEKDWSMKLKKETDGDNEDESTVIQTSDDESVPESQEEKNIVMVLKNYIAILPELLTKSPGGVLAGSMHSEDFVPLGQYRLMLTKLVYLILKLNKNELNDDLISNDIFRTLSGLMKQYPWNNFFQLRIIAIYDEVIEHSKNPAFRETVLKNSNLIETILSINGETHFSFESDRRIRHGYMGMITKISNFLTSASSIQDVSDVLDTHDTWGHYAEGELKQINEINTKKLGGQEPKPAGSEEDDQTFEPMDQIMARFSNFSSNSSAVATDDDDEEDEFETSNQPETVFTGEQETGLVEVTIEEEQPEEKEFYGHLYWKKPLQYDIDDLDLSDF
jgi:hypothetical protein